jgi:hypothetical protein
MIISNSEHEDIHTPREKLLEKRIEILQERIHELENEALINPLMSKLNDQENSKKTKASFLVLPVTYTPEQERTPTLEIVSYSPLDDSNNQLLLVEKSNSRVYETIV